MFLLKRHRRASFMSNAFVFPGGKIDPDDGSPEVAAVRELFEEAGVLLGDRSLTPDAQAGWRRRLLAGEASFAELIAAERLAPDRSRLRPWSRWITPSFEPKRFDAQFFLAELPPDQVPSFDAQETVEELWVTPADALARQSAGTLRLPPPQLRTFHELAACASLGIALARAGERQKSPAALCPRMLGGPAGLGPAGGEAKRSPLIGEGITLLLPWDPDYAGAEGEGTPLAPDHPWATPPSRFHWDGATWHAL